MHANDSFRFNSTRLVLTRRVSTLVRFWEFDSSTDEFIAEIIEILNQLLPPPPLYPPKKANRSSNTNKCLASNYFYCSLIRWATNRNIIKIGVNIYWMWLNLFGKYSRYVSLAKRALEKWFARMSPGSRAKRYWQAHQLPPHCLFVISCLPSPVIMAEINVDYPTNSIFITSFNACMDIYELMIFFFFFDIFWCDGKPRNLSNI